MSTSLKNENRQSILLGLTGGIGSGKSTIAKVFKSLGIPVFDADTEAKKIVNENNEVKELIEIEFGNVFNAGKLDSQKMAEIVFNDEQALTKLNHIVHPKVKDGFDAWVNENSEYPFLIKEAAILIEIGGNEQMDKIILVKAPEAIKIKRVMSRDNVSEIKVKERMDAQLTDEEKSKYADFTIVNDGKELVIPQVLKIYEQLKSLN